MENKEELKQTKTITYGQETKNNLAKGLEMLYNSVKTTYGPNGHTVLIKHPYFVPTITKDGVTVAKSISSTDPFIDAGIQAIKEVASKTNQSVGDGTTTATILAYAMYEAYKKVRADLPSRIMDKEIVKGIKIAVEKISAYIKKHSRKITNRDIFNIAMISSNGDKEISSIVTEAIKKVTTDGSITIEENTANEMNLTVIPGIEINKGYTSSYFVNNEATGECIFKNPLILVYEGRINEINEIVHILEITCASATKRPVVIFADSVESDALGIVITNKIKAGIEACVVGAPYFGDRRRKVMMDVAKITGARYVSAKESLKTLDRDTLGSCEKIVIGKNNTVIHNGSNQKTQEFADYVEGIKSQIPSLVNTFEQEQEQERVAKLIGGIAIIKVGGLTEPEVQEKKDRVDDALHACKAAIEGGTVIGGGKSFYNAYHYFGFGNSYSEGENVGINIVRSAILKPIEILYENSGHIFSEVAKLMMTSNVDHGESLDLNTLEKINLRSKKVIDPTKVVITALSNASSIVELLISTDFVVLTKN